MADYGTKVTDKAIKKLDKEIQSIYQEAADDIKKKTDDFFKKYKAKDAIMQDKLKKGLITQEEYSNWLSGQIFQQKQWALKKYDIEHILTESNKIATNMINNESIHVFSAAYNYESYSLEHMANVDFNFQLYDSSAVTNLVKNNPQVLPKWKINEPKDYVWNGKKVNRQVTQGIIQGESLDQIATRLAVNLSTQNYNHMRTFARTAMTGAQNSGREFALKNARDMGLNVVKQWMATLDGRTRDSHAKMDGETIKVGDKWHHYKFSNGLRYPGDPEGPAREVYNCRCTLVGDLEDYPSEFERYDNIDGKPIKNMTYDEWYKAKEAQKKQKEILEKYGSPEDAQKAVDILQDKIKAKGADKVFSGIWKEDVTYADWEDKKDAIQGKRDFYNERLPKAKQQFIDKHLNDLDDEDAQKIVDMLIKHDGGDFADLWNDNSDYLMKYIGYKPQEFIDIYDEFYSSWEGTKIRKMTQYLKDLDEFEKHGEEYSKLLKELEEAKKRQLEIKKAHQVNPFDADAYSQRRKDNAVWAKSPEEADRALRETCGEVWRNASYEEREAIYEYTRSYHKFNEPLRGIEYGTSKYLGVGKTDLNAGRADNGKRLNAMTRIIDKSVSKQDQWFQRGCRFGGMDKFFQCSEELLRNGTEKELKRELLGKSVTEYGFMSMGSSKGRGFTGDIMLNIYTPEGTKMMYVEPFSAFGYGDGLSWDGKSKQSGFGSELETILQQGSELRVTKITRESTWDTIYFDLEVIDQSHQQYWQGK